MANRKALEVKRKAGDPDPYPTVLIRADKDTPVEFTKKVVAASGAAGSINFVFSALRVEKKPATDE